MKKECGTKDRPLTGSNEIEDAVKEGCKKIIIKKPTADITTEKTKIKDALKGYSLDNDDEFIQVWIKKS